jgi:hypothetical protein
MEAKSSFETSFDFQWIKRHFIPEDIILHSIYEFLLQQTSFSLNKLHFLFNEQITILRSFFAKAENYIHNAWWRGK